MPPRAPNRPRSPLTLVVLALLFEAPMHPYRMQKLVRERGQDTLVNVKSRHSVQQTVTRLERDGLIASTGTEQTGTAPQRTTYALTPAGRDELHETIHQLLAHPAEEYPLFPAALAFMSIVSTGTAAELLTERRERLTLALEDIRRSTAAAPPSLPRIFLIENDYGIALREAEIAWLDRTLDALASGELSWDTEALIGQSVTAARPE